MADYMNGEDNGNVELTGIFKQGYGYIPKSIMKFRYISIQAKAVYAYIASYAGKNGLSYPGRELMCYDLGISQDSINKYLKELVMYDIIYKKQQRQEGNKFANNLYKLNYNLELNNEPMQENSVTENKGTPMQELSVMEELANGDTDNEKSLYNNNSNNNNNYNNNSLLNNNRENKNSLQSFKSLIDKYFSNSNNDIKELVSQFIELKEEKGKPFISENQFSHFADSLNAIKEEKDKILCLQYSLTNGYINIHPENYKTISREEREEREKREKENEEFWDSFFNFE